MRSGFAAPILLRTRAGDATLAAVPRDRGSIAFSNARPRPRSHLDRSDPAERRADGSLRDAVLKRRVLDVFEDQGG